MASWAHLEITVNDQGDVEVGGYNADPEALVEGTESWEDLLSTLGVNGWELVQVVPGPDGNGLVAYLKREKNAS